MTNCKAEIYTTTLQGLHQSAPTEDFQRYMYQISNIPTFKQKKIARGKVQMNIRIDKPVRR